MQNTAANLTFREIYGVCFWFSAGLFYQNRL